MKLTHRRTAAVAALPRLWWKRPLDLLAAIVLLVPGLPLIGVLALLVAFESRGPVFFRQERVGQHGTRFRIWKLRSMRHGCPDETHRVAVSEWFAGHPDAEPYKTLADPRVTGRVGRWLRRVDLDELPQLFNVLRGEMSLVGPRPAIPYELGLYQPAYLDRLEVPPGLTGLWQVTSRDRLSAAEMMTLDLRYVRDASLGLDLRILALTAVAVLGAAIGER
jgi:lipopolysaccharide/colanic/teichoic acid biosynthesis glycosyltransferase